MEENILVADTETTGLEDPIHIVEVGWQLIDVRNMELLSRYDTVVNPGVPIPAEASAVHGIRDEDVVDAISIDEAFFPELPVILVCHNVKYDRPLLERHLNIAGELCTYMVSRRLIPEAPNHKLGTLVEYLGLEKAVAHRVYGDVNSVYNLLVYMMEALEWDFQQLYEFSQRKFIYKNMPLGKHKGKPCKEVPRGYWYWVLQEDFDKDMRDTAKFYLGRK